MSDIKVEKKSDALFTEMVSFRASKEIEAIINYHVKHDKDAQGKDVYSSEGHFIRSAILFMNRFKGKN